jgi:hypothetical protein
MPNTARVEFTISAEEYELVVQAMVYSWIKNGIDEMGQKINPGIKALGKIEPIELKFMIASAMEKVLPTYKEELMMRRTEK